MYPANTLKAMRAMALAAALAPSTVQSQESAPVPDFMPQPGPSAAEGLSLRQPTQGTEPPAPAQPIETAPPASSATPADAVQGDLGNTPPTVPKGRVVIGPPSPWVHVAAVPAGPFPQLSPGPGGVALVLSDRQVRVATEETFVRIAKVILNEAGLRTASQISIDFDPSYQALALHEVGIRRRDESLSRLQPGAVRLLQRETEIESYQMNGQMSAMLVLEDVRIGDVLDVAYTLVGRNPVFKGIFCDVAPLADYQPLLALRYRLLWRGQDRPGWKVIGADLPPQQALVNGEVEYIWERHNVPAAAISQDAPAWYDPVPWLHLSAFPSWEAVGEWARSMFDPNAREPARDGLPFDPATASPEQILDFVQNDVRYLSVVMGAGSHRPAEPSVVAKRRYGDCKDKSLLLCSLLQAKGVTARPVLVHSRLRHLVQDILPSPLAFDHVIANAYINGESCWIDATVSGQTGPPKARGMEPFACGLAVGEFTEGLIRIPSTAMVSGGIAIEESIDARQAGSPARLDVTARYTGLEADYIRHIQQALGDQEFRSSFARIYGNMFPGAGPPLAFRLAPESGGGAMILSQSYEIKSFWQTNASTHFVSANVMPALLHSALPSGDRAERTAPLAIRHPRTVRSLTRIQLPPEFEIRPETVDVACDWFHATGSSRLTNGVYTLDYKLETRADHVPAAAVAAYSEKAAEFAHRTGVVLYQADPDRPKTTGSSLRDKPHVPTALVMGLAAGLVLLFLLILVDLPALPISSHERSSEYRGIGGGLILVGLIMAAKTFFNGSLLFGRVFYQDEEGVRQLTDPASSAFDPTTVALMEFQLGWIGFLFVFLLAAWTLFFWRRSSFPYAFTAIVLLDLTLGFVIRSMVRSTSLYHPWTNYVPLGTMMGWAAGAALMVAYLVRSRRVRNTFRTRLFRHRHH